MFHYTDIDWKELSEESYIDNYISYFFQFLNEKQIEVWWEWADKLTKVFSRIQENFNGQYRKDGEPYISHLIEVAKIFIENLWVSNTSFDDIIIALLHDSIEDIKHENFHSIQQDFWDYVALWVLALSKPELKTSPTKPEKILKKERNKKYYPRFASSDTLRNYISEKSKEENININDNKITKLSRIVGQIKLCDRIHNLRTMPLKKHKKDKTGFSVEKKEAKLKESRYFRWLLNEIWNYNITRDFFRAELFWNQSIFWEKIRLWLTN